MECLFNPAGCFNDGVASLLAWYPFGIEGVKASVWMIVGAMLGKVGVGAVLVLGAALKASGKKETDIFPHEDPVPTRAPKPKKRRLL